MDKNQLMNILNNLLQEENTTLPRNQAFSLLSVITLLEIVNLYRKKDMEVKQSSSQNSGDPITQLISNLPAEKGNVNLQQMLPLLLNLLGNSNNEQLPISNILQLLSSSSSSSPSSNITEVKDEEDTKEEEENNKKKL